jgi:hypothetical protein
MRAFFRRLSLRFTRNPEPRAIVSTHCGVT